MLTHNVGSSVPRGGAERRLFSHPEGSMKHMKQSILLRIASGLTLVFFGGHTLRGLDPSSRGPEEAAVFMAMQSYPFSIMGFRRTHWDFYRGFSLLFSVALLLLAVLLWQLGGIAKSDPA